MFAIIDSRSSEKAVNNLKEYVTDVYKFQTSGITGNSISGHPDIFIYSSHNGFRIKSEIKLSEYNCNQDLVTRKSENQIGFSIYQDNHQLVVAPNAPVELFEFLNNHKITYLKGKRDIGDELKNSTRYNCLSTPDFLFHKPGYTDPTILEINKDKEFIQLPQPYTRCSLVHLYENNYLTSDRGIEKVLLGKGLSCFYFNPEEITIRGHDNGFIGGAVGIWGKRIFFNGNVKLHADGKRLCVYLLSLDFEIVNLSDEYLYDGGCIFFV